MVTAARRLSPQTRAVLLALAEQGGGWSHGYDLCGRLGIRAGTMYPILIRLAERGQVETTWEDAPPRGRPPRHLYRLSTAGAELAGRVRTEQAAPIGGARGRLAPSRPVPLTEGA